MRSSGYLSLGAAVILVLVLSTAMEAEAIRLDAEARASVSSTSQMAIDKPNENAVKGPASSISETKASTVVAAREVRTVAVAHKLPEFHEDYYGPSDHGPRHH